ncbi:MAG: hypothetical protein PHW95_03450 [Patescibacteria group bacterium]|nr:hypothetical protein [Patescibacteria group bacterium]
MNREKYIPSDFAGAEIGEGSQLLQKRQTLVESGASLFSIGATSEGQEYLASLRHVLNIEGDEVLSEDVADALSAETLELMETREAVLTKMGPDFLDTIKKIPRDLLLSDGRAILRVVLGITASSAVEPRSLGLAVGGVLIAKEMLWPKLRSLLANRSLRKEIYGTKDK